MRAASIILLAAIVSAQTPPDFSGRWILAPEPASPGGRAAATGVGSGWGSDITVTQDAATLTIEYARFARGDMQPPAKFVYRLDGSDSKNTINLGRGPQEQTSRAAWDSGKLVIRTQHAFKPSRDSGVVTSETVHVLTLESPALLVIETTHGAVMGGQASVSKSIYKKN
jgi:hypothetical protein